MSEPLSSERPFVVDHSKFEKAFGADPTPLDEAIDTTLAWFKQSKKLTSRDIC